MATSSPLHSAGLSLTTTTAAGRRSAAKRPTGRRAGGDDRDRAERGAHRCGSLIAAGALVTENADIPPGSPVAGVPGEVRGSLNDDKLTHVLSNAATYVEPARRHGAAPTEQR